MIKINPQFEELQTPFSEKLKNSIQRETTSHKEILRQLLEEIEPVDFESKVFPQKAKLNKESEGSEVQDQLGKLKVNQKHFLVIVIEELLQVARSKNWGLCNNGDFIYLYNGEFWLCQDKKALEGFLGEVAERMGVPYFDAQFYDFRAKLLKQFQSTAILPPPEKEDNSVFINLKNGTFEISPNGKRLRPFNQNDFLTYQLPFDYNETATAPIFQRFLDRVLPDKESQLILAEFLGYLFVPNGSKKLKEEKALVLYGTGANGKSVFYEVVSSLLGSTNCSSYSLENLTDKSGYYRAMIGNVLVNYASEISHNFQTDIFKKITSGEPIDARLPYGNPMLLTQYAKLIFNCNELPKDVEHTRAYFRRFLIIPFKVRIPEEEQDKSLHSKIVENELSGVFNWVLSGLDRLLEKKRFSSCKSSEEALKDYEIQSDSVKLFLEDKEFVKCPLNEKTIYLKELFTQYRGYCVEDGYKAVSKRSFVARIKAFEFETKRRNDGIVVFAYSKENIF